MEKVKENMMIDKQDNVMFVTKMDIMQGTVTIEIGIVVEIMIIDMIVEEVEAEKKITIVDLLAIILDQVLQVEKATEKEEVIVGIMTEEETIEKIRKRIPTIIPETIDYLMKERLVNLYTTLY